MQQVECSACLEALVDAQSPAGWDICTERNHLHHATAPSDCAIWTATTAVAICAVAAVSPGNAREPEHTGACRAADCHLGVRSQTFAFKAFAYKHRAMHQVIATRAGELCMCDRHMVCRELISREEGHITDDLASLMDQNFAIRKRMYGDEALGAESLEMIKTAKSVGAAAKFCGSGGCILALCPGGEDQAVKLLGAWPWPLCLYGYERSRSLMQSRERARPVRSMSLCTGVARCGFQACLRFAATGSAVQHVDQVSADGTAIQSRQY